MYIAETSCKDVKWIELASPMGFCECSEEPTTNNYTVLKGNCIPCKKLVTAIQDR
jgi:hypothetical protein